MLWPSLGLRVCIISPTYLILCRCGTLWYVTIFFLLLPETCPYRTKGPVWQFTFSVPGFLIEILYSSSIFYGSTDEKTRFLDFLPIYLRIITPMDSFVHLFLFFSPLTFVSKSLLLPQCEEVHDKNISRLRILVSKCLGSV